MSKPTFDSDLVELFREALMKKHSNDWDMETVAEAAYICAEAIQPLVETWAYTLEKRPGKANKYQGKAHSEPRPRRLP
jgi:hypothetical protein